MEKLKPRVGSAVIVENSGKVLLGQRNKENCRGSWIIPGGGVDFGEKIEDAAIREIKEETNLDVEIVKFVGHKEIINTPGDYHGVVFFHLAKLKNPDSEISVSDDLSDAKFFSIDEIKKLDILESVEWALKQAGFWD